MFDCGLVQVLTDVLATNYNQPDSFCNRFLESQLDPSNCIGLVSFAEELGLLDLKEKIDKYIRTHFCEVMSMRSIAKTRLWGFIFEFYAPGRP